MAGVVTADNEPEWLTLTCVHSFNSLTELPEAFKIRPMERRPIQITTLLQFCLVLRKSIWSRLMCKNIYKTIKSLIWYFVVVLVLFCDHGESGVYCTYQIKLYHHLNKIVIITLFHWVVKFKHDLSVY